jgi:hypothetical protein
MTAIGIIVGLIGAAVGIVVGLVGGLVGLVLGLLGGLLGLLPLLLPVLLIILGINWLMKESNSSYMAGARADRGVAGRPHNPGNLR